MQRFSFYHICNYRHEHTTVFKGWGFVQNFRSLLKVNWLFFFFFCKISNLLLFPMFYAADTSFSFLSPIHWVHANNCNLAAFHFMIFGTIIISYYSTALLLYNPVLGNQKTQLASTKTILCTFPLKQTSQNKQKYTIILFSLSLHGFIE